MMLVGYPSQPPRADTTDAIRSTCDAFDEIAAAYYFQRYDPASDPGPVLVVGVRLDGDMPLDMLERVFARIAGHITPGLPDGQCVDVIDVDMSPAFTDLATPERAFYVR